MALIQDVTPSEDGNRPTTLMPMDKQAALAKQLDERVLITELYKRGISVQHIFGAYYALDEMVTHGNTMLTVADAELAAPPDQPKNNEGIPF